MEILYAKTVLYGYPVLENLIEQIDESVEKKALNSIRDYSPCYSQCERIIDMINVKTLLIDLKIAVDGIIKKFSDHEIMHFEYKYFKNRDKEYFKDFDATSRKYFRKQNSLAKRFSDLLEKSGIDDRKFEDEYLSVDFFRELFKRVSEREERSVKAAVKSVSEAA